MNIQCDTAKTKERKQQLKEMYDRYYQDGICKYYDLCSQNAINDGNTKGYHSSYAVSIGDNYDFCFNHEAIRILFVGKEGRNRNCDIDQAARLSSFLPEGKVNLHYQETYKMLCEMLNYNWKDGRCSDSNKYLYKPDANLTCYALTNLYRCAFKKCPSQVSNIKNYPPQDEHCLAILKEEIKILQPTIIVLQKNGLRATAIAPDATPCKDEANDEVYGVYKSENTYIIETIHPRNFGKWYKTYKPLFSKALTYLRTIGKLPALDCDTTDELNRIVKGQA